MAKEYLEKLSAFMKVATIDLPGDVNIECKHFFSGAAVYADGKICISLTPVGLAMKLPANIKEKLLQNKKAVPLRYFPNGPIKKEYALFPDGVTKNKIILYRYINESIRYAGTLPNTK